MQPQFASSGRSSVASNANILLHANHAVPCGHAFTTIQTIVMIIMKVITNVMKLMTVSMMVMVMMMEIITMMMMMKAGAGGCRRLCIPVCRPDPPIGKAASRSLREEEEEEERR